MKCAAEGCDRDARYKKLQLCQKHYFRHWRYGTTDLTNSRAYRYTHSNGYQMIYEPSHPLSQEKGYIYEHRFVLFNAKGYSLTECESCGKEWSWSNIYGSHVDHIDCDKSNNKIENLRPLCNACNVNRHRKPEHEYKGNLAITYKERTMTANEWGRESDVPVAGYTIRARIKAGWSAEKALFTPSRKKSKNN